eukprot:jgi/Chlat1/6327/Chrsp44S05890
MGLEVEEPFMILMMTSIATLVKIAKKQLQQPRVLLQLQRGIGDAALQLKQHTRAMLHAVHGGIWSLTSQPARLFVASAQLQTVAEALEVNGEQPLRLHDWQLRSKHAEEESEQVAYACRLWLR